jgi:lipoprotein NlpD
VKKLSLCLYLGVSTAILSGCAAGTFQDNQYYTVKKRDTLSKIAATYDLNYQILARQNNLQYPYILQVGQRLYVGVPPTGNANYASSLPKRTTINMNTTSTVQPIATTNQLQGQTLNLSQYSAPAPKPVASKPKPTNPGIVGLKVSSSDETTNNTITWAWPVDGTIVQGFGEGTDLMARGIQISVPTNSQVLAAAEGQVIFGGTGAKGYGKMVIIKHGNNFLTAYTDLSQVLVHQDQKVSLGTPIGVSGMINGRSLVHFEVRKFGSPVNPTAYLPMPADLKPSTATKPISKYKIDNAD